MTRASGDHYLYRAYDANDVCLYIGVTTNVRRRIREHHARDWFPQVARWDVSEPMFRLHAAAAERSAIHCERPRYNIRHNVRTAA